MGSKSNTIDKVRNQIIDRGLVIGSIAATIVYVLSISKLFTTGFELSFITDFLVVSMIVVTTIYRKKLNVEIKSYAVLIGIIFVVFVDIYEIGILSANKILLILIPFFAVISLNFRKTLIFSIFTLIGILVLAGLHISGVLIADTSANVDPVAWIINFAIIALVTFLMLLIVTRFNKTYEELIDDLVKSNQLIRENESRLQEYRDQLEELVKDRTSELEQTNEKLQIQTSELKETIDKLNAAKDQLVQSEKMASIGLMASGVAHEINNPINYVQAGLYSIDALFKDAKTLKTDGELKNNLDEVTKRMKFGVDRVNQIVSSLNHYNSKDERKIACDLHEVLENSVVILGHKWKGKCSILRNYYDGPLTLLANEGDLHQLFVNVLSNSIQAIEAEGQINISTSLSKSEVKVEIEDNGEGIRKENMGKLFDPFFTTKSQGEGSGLGLYISHRIVKDLNGTLDITSEPYKGTKVTISLLTKN